MEAAWIETFYQETDAPKRLELLKQNTENEVFTACEEAVEEIFALIRRLSGSANTYHFIVTADHGFIYKRDKLQESDKIINLADKDAFVNRRFVVSEEALEDDDALDEDED